MIGSQGEFDYDAVADLVFNNVTHFQAFFGLYQQPDNAARIAAHEDQFLDCPKMTVVVVGETTVTTK